MVCEEIVVVGPWLPVDASMSLTWHIWNLLGQSVEHPGSYLVTSRVHRGMRGFAGYLGAWIPETSELSSLGNSQV